MEDRCVCCGEIIPEGRMVCSICEANSMKIGKILQTQNATPEEVERAYKSIRKESKDDE